MKKIVLHIDVNSAFLSWTAKKMLKEGADIDIRKIPSIIGGDRERRHGIVLAKSIPAKKYGIYTAQTVVDALRKCPDLVIVPPDHDYYNEQSKKFVDILLEYTPDVEQVSVDECYMDFTGISKKYGSPIEFAHTIKDRIKNELGFTVNVGISDRKVLAKMASDFQKPDKVHTLFSHEIKYKMWQLPVEDLYMAGKSSTECLHKLGVFTIGQLAQTPPDILEIHLKSHGRLLWEYANGIDANMVESQKEELKGIGNSTTLSKDVIDVEEINKVLLELSEKVAKRIREARQKANVVCVEVKYSDFAKMSKQTTVELPVSTSGEIYEIAKELFMQLWNNKPVRLLGIRTTKLVSENEPEQMSLFNMSDSTEDKKQKDSASRQNKNKEAGVPRDKMMALENALDGIKKKYGDDVVSRASLLRRKNDER